MIPKTRIGSLGHVEVEVPIDSLAGQTLDGRFALRTLLGAGSFGAVYEALEVAADRAVAVKVLHRHKRADREVAGRFVREARVLAALRHPAIVEVIDAGETSDGLLFLVTELLEGKNLHQEMQARRLGDERRQVGGDEIVDPRLVVSTIDEHLVPRCQQRAERAIRAL